MFQKIIRFGGFRSPKRFAWFLALVIAALILTARAGPRILEFFKPIDVKGITLSGGSKAQWNRIDMGPKLGLLLDRRAVQKHMDRGFLLSYDLFIKRMGQMDVSLVYPDHDTLFLASITSPNMWPYADRILRGRPITMTVHALGNGSISLIIDDKSWNLVHDDRPLPFEVAITFLDGEISILDASLRNSSDNGLPADEHGDIVESLRPRGADQWTGIVFFVVIVCSFLIFHLIDNDLDMSDSLSPIALLAGLAFVLTARTVNPAAILFVFLAAFFLKGFYVLIRRRPYRRTWLSLLIFPAVAGAGLFLLTDLPAAAVFILLSALCVPAIIESVRRRRLIRLAQALPPLFILLALIFLEIAVRAAFPGGRILHGASEDLFWSMAPENLKTDKYSDISNPPLFQGASLKKKDERTRPAAVILGGSVIFGDPSGKDRNVPWLVQEKIGGLADVFDAGILGAASNEIMVNFCTRIAPLQPEVVVAYLLHNDIYQPGPLTGRQVRERRRIDREIRGFLAHSALYRYTAETVAKWKAHADIGRPGEEDIVASFKANLEDLSDAVAAYGGRLVLLPEQVRFKDKNRVIAMRLADTMHEVAAAKGVRLVEISIPDKDENGKPTFADNVHLTASGYRYLIPYLASGIKAALDNK